MTHKDKILGSRCLHKGWMNILDVDAVLAGERTQRLLVEHPSGSAVLPFNAERRVALTVRQSRLAVMYAGQATLAEPVAGVAEDESWEETARRECEEEVGVRLTNLEAVGQVWMTSSSTTERVHLFLGEYDDRAKTGEGGGAEGEAEELDVREEPLAQLWADVMEGQMADAKLFMLLQALRLLRPELFEGA